MASVLHIIFEFSTNGSGCVSEWVYLLYEYKSHRWLISIIIISSNQFIEMEA